MTLSPFEVERREFGRSPMGYSRKEVDHFLDEIHQTFVALWQERAELREENERLGERVARFTALEEQLKNTLLLAQDSAEKACEQARRESELVMREAGQKAREIVHAAHEERQRLELALRELQSAEQETRQRFKALAQAVLTHLDDAEASVSEQVTSLRAVVQPVSGKRERRPIEAPPSFDAARYAPRQQGSADGTETIATTDFSAPGGITTGARSPKPATTGGRGDAAATKTGAAAATTAATTD